MAGAMPLRAVPARAEQPCRNCRLLGMSGLIEEEPGVAEQG